MGDREEGRERERAQEREAEIEKREFVERTIPEEFSPVFLD